jgi:hypothetical protein
MTLTGVPRKRERWTNEKLVQLDRQLISVLQQDRPQSVRHLYYRMTNPRLAVHVEKDGDNLGYDRVQRRLKLLRENGTIPYGWIVDATRRGYHTTTYRSAAEFIEATHGLYRGDLWQQSDYYCEVWVESRSIAGTILKDCKELAVSLYPAGGCTSLTLPYEAATEINEKTEFALDEDGVRKEVVIIYIGDYDPAGVLIDRDIKSKLREHLDPTLDLNFRRIAITEEQIEKYDLPAKPRNPKEKRAPHITVTVEAEAMPAHILRGILRSEIEGLLPEGALEVAKVAEREERRLLRSFAQQLADEAAQP